MGDDLFEPAGWGRIFISSIAIFVLGTIGWLASGYPIGTAATAGLWLGPGLVVGMFLGAIVMWACKRVF